MCIRDSIQSAHQDPDVWFDKEAFAPDYTLDVTPATQAICCLLYTSDAADERSSVDLGGRRIIKKKTNYDITAAVQGNADGGDYASYISARATL